MLTKFFAAMILVLVISTGVTSAEEGEKFDSFTITALRGDTPWGMWVSHKSTREIPWAEWLVEFAAVNGVENSDSAFRRLPISEWNLPIRQKAKTAFQVVTPLTEVATESLTVPVDYYTTMATIQGEKNDLQKSLRFAEEENAALFGQKVDLTQKVESAEAEVAAAKAELATKDARLAELTSELEARKANPAGFAVTKWQFAAGSIVVGLLLAGLLFFVFRVRRLRLERDELQKSLFDITEERDEAVPRLINEKGDLLEQNQQLQKDNARLVEMLECTLYRYELPPDLRTQSGESFVLLLILRHKAPGVEPRVLLLEKNGNENLNPGPTCRISQVESHFRQDPRRYGLVVAEEEHQTGAHQRREREAVPVA